MPKLTKMSEEDKRESHRISSAKLYNKDREHSLAIQKKSREKSKEIIINYYSKGKNCCDCCGETTKEFLTLDHINNDGTQERRKLNGGGHHNYRFIIKNNFPPGYRIMCYNCNCGRARTINKICPHKIYGKNKKEVK